MADVCGTEGMTRWTPQRSWPSACASDVATDGLVLLEGDALPSYALGGDGELHVTVERIVQGQAVETFEGKVSYPDPTSALFQSNRPLAPQSDYQITALRGAAQDVGRFTSAFSTGTRTLDALTFQGAPSVTFEEVEGARSECVIDACGKKNCKPGDDAVQLKSVRVAVPPVAGGVDVRPVSIAANLVATFADGTAPRVATSDAVATQAGKRSFIVIELPALPSNAQGCVTITATDVAGHALTSEPICTALPADEQPYDDDVEDVAVVDKLAHTTDPSTADEVDLESASIEPHVEASAGGCAIGTSSATFGNLGWMAAALTLAGLRSRKRRD